MQGLVITIYYEQQNKPNSYERHNMLPYKATIANNNVSIDIPTLKETHIRRG